jgi:myosin light chain 6
VFAYFDTRGDEKIAVSQVGEVLRALGQNPTEAEIHKCCEHWRDSGELGGRTDTNRASTETRITFEEFLPIYQSINKTRTTHSVDEFIEGLSHFDKDGNGTINVAELRHLLTTLGACTARVRRTHIHAQASVCPMRKSTNCSPAKRTRWAM